MVVVNERCEGVNGTEQRVHNSGVYMGSTNLISPLSASITACRSITIDVIVEVPALPYRLKLQDCVVRMLMLLTVVSLLARLGTTLHMESRGNHKGKTIGWGYEPCGVGCCTSTSLDWPCISYAREHELRANPPQG